MTADALEAATTQAAHVGLGVLLATTFACATVGVLVLTFNLVRGMLRR